MKHSYMLVTGKTAKGDNPYR